MSRAVSMLLLNALLDDCSLIRRSEADSAEARSESAVQPAVSPAVGRRMIAAERWAETPGTAGDPDLPVLIHGPAASAFAAYRPASALWPAVGVDVAEDRDRHCVESVHRSLAQVADLPRSVPVTVGLALEPGWRDALNLIMARGRSVRFAVCGVDAPDAPVLVDALRTAVAERCEFSWSCGAWQAVTDPWSAPVPGILNVLLAVAAALGGATASQVGEQLARTDPVDILDALSDLDEAAAREIRTVLGGFAVPRVDPVVDALSALDLLPKVR